LPPIQLIKLLIFITAFRQQRTANGGNYSVKITAAVYRLTAVRFNKNNLSKLFFKKIRSKMQELQTVTQ